MVLPEVYRKPVEPEQAHCGAVLAAETPEVHLDFTRIRGRSTALQPSRTPGAIHRARTSRGRLVRAAPRTTKLNRHKIEPIVKQSEVASVGRDDPKRSFPSRHRHRSVDHIGGASDAAELTGCPSSPVVEDEDLAQRRT